MAKDKEGWSGNGREETHLLHVDPPVERSPDQTHRRVLRLLVEVDGDLAEHGGRDGLRS